MGTYRNEHHEALKVSVLGGRIVEPGAEFTVSDDLDIYFAVDEQPETDEAIANGSVVARDDEGNPIRVGFSHPYMTRVDVTKPSAPPAPTPTSPAARPVPATAPAAPAAPTDSTPASPAAQ